MTYKEMEDYLANLSLENLNGFEYDIRAIGKSLIKHMPSDLKSEEEERIFLSLFENAAADQVKSAINIEYYASKRI